MESKTISIINTICWKIPLDCQWKCSISDIIFFNGFTNTREGYGAGNLTVRAVQLEKQSGKSSFQVLGQTWAQRKFCSSKGPEKVCGCETHEQRRCPFHPAERSTALLSQRQETKDGSWRKSSHLAAYQVTRRSPRGWMRGTQKEGELERNSWALLPAPPLLLEPLTARLKVLGFALGIGNLPRGWEAAWRALGHRRPCQKLVGAQAFLHPTPLLSWATHASADHPEALLRLALCARSKAQRLWCREPPLPAGLQGTGALLTLAGVIDRIFFWGWHGAFWCKKDLHPPGIFLHRQSSYRSICYETLVLG